MAISRISMAYIILLPLLKSLYHNIYSLFNPVFSIKSIYSIIFYTSSIYYIVDTGS